MTLSDLTRMASVISIRRLAAAVGMNPTTLKSRIRRGSPELTPEESQAIMAALTKAGFNVPA